MKRIIFPILCIQHRVRCLLLLCCLCILSNAHAGNTNYFAFTNSLGQPITNTTVTLTPTSVQAVNGFNGADPLTFTTTNDGTFLATNLLPGTYQVRENNSFFIVTEPSGNGFFSMATNVSGLLAPGTTAVYTRAQSDARYFQSTNALVIGASASNTTFVGGINFSSATATNGIFNDATNLSGMFSNATLIGSTIISGPLSFGAATTNLQTETAVYTIIGPTNLLPGVTTNATVTMSGVGTNGDWDFTITPGPAFTNTSTNVLVSILGVPATNTLVINFADVGTNNFTNNLGTNGYRITARQWR